MLYKIEPTGSCLLFESSKALAKSVSVISPVSIKASPTALFISVNVLGICFSTVCAGSGI